MSASSEALKQLASIPIILTPVLGRTIELDHMMSLVDEPSQRLITLTGPGGVGKTRLALHIAATLIDEFDRDVVYVPLAAIRDPALVLPAIGQALGLLIDANDAGDERIVESLQARLPLLVLDNFEQVLDAAPSITRILARCPEITILVTSQAPLGIAGEQLYPLLPLTTPSAEQTSAETILRSDAVALFVARARSVKPTLVIDDRTAVTIAAICRKLDGLPLAIELAAARINILSPDALLARLSNRLQVLGGERRDVPDRLRTMRHAIGWSYDLLAPDEQALFRQMSVFAGGISLDAAESLFQAADNDRDVFGVLSALVDHSLVQAVSLTSGDARFLMLETLRDYGLEQLDTLGECDRSRLDHATYFLNLAETAEPHLIGGRQEEWLNQLDPEWDNIRAALDWSLDHGHPQIAVRIFGAIWRFCSTRGHVTEGRVFVGRALDATRGDESPARNLALIGAGYLAEDQRDLDAAREYFDQAQVLALRIGNELFESQSLIGLGTVAHDRGDYITAIDCHNRALNLARKSGDQRTIAIAHGNLAAVSYFQGNLDDAERHWEEGRVLLRATGDTQAESLAASNLGALASERGEFERAREMLDRALELQRGMNAVRDLSYTLANLAEAWFRLGDYALAEDQFTEAIALFRDYADAGSEAVVLGSHAKLALAQDELARAAGMILDGMPILTEIGDRHSIVRNAETLAALCVRHQDHATAVELLASADLIRQEIGAALNPVERGEVESATSSARQALREQKFASHWATGSKIDIDALARRVAIVARELTGSRQPAGPSIPQETPSVQPNLTAREAEVLRLLAEGQSTREISAALFISPRTTATHVTNILGKLDVTSRTAAVAHAMRTGLV
jgi:predicted ATPase/DNA-binding CsgD family transcriptional regulator